MILIPFRFFIRFQLNNHDDDDEEEEDEEKTI